MPRRAFQSLPLRQCVSLDLKVQYTCMEAITQEHPANTAPWHMKTCCESFICVLRMTCSLVLLIR